MIPLWLGILCSAVGHADVADSLTHSSPYVQVSLSDPRYFELSDGQPYIPIGLNMVHPLDGTGGGLAVMDRWFQALSSNGGNYARIWLSNDFWDIEHERSGEYDGAKAERIDALLELARKYGIRLKLTIEHFRHLGDGPRWCGKPQHHVSQGGPAESIEDFFEGERSREQFRGKIAWYAQRYGDDPVVFGWELWNEINAVRGGDIMTWTEEMLVELRRQFPKNLVMQSLGSFDRSGNRHTYQRMSTMPNNDVAQVHRYLDLGAQLEVCHGPVDVLVADAVHELQAFQPGRPILLAESGAVEPSHTGPFKLYAKDTHGIILHDVLFAPFFAGAAGPGQIWHWDAYVDRMNLWHHYGRFAVAVNGINPVSEAFEPIQIPHDRLRVLVLKGKKTLLAWCRDAGSGWRSELQEQRPPERLSGLALQLPEGIQLSDATSVDVYDPWTNQWSTPPTSDGVIQLPDFSRSIVIRGGIH